MLRFFNRHKSEQASRLSEAGNVFFLVIVGVALFAALGVTFSRGTRTGTDRISSKLADLYTQEIMTYGQQLVRATNRVYGDGYSENDISFENTIVTTGYANANCTSDECEVFHIDGGAVKYKEPDSNWLDGSHSGKEAYGEWRFTRAMCVEDTDSSCDDAATNDDELVALLPYIRKEICEKINKQLQITDSTTPQDPGRAIPDTLEKYDGTAPGSSQTLADPGSLLLDKTAGCFTSDTGTLDGAYTFFQVLIQR